MLKKILLAGAASTLLIGTAQAADIEAPPEVYDWTGGYIGLQAGYAWDSDVLDVDVTPLLGVPTDVGDLDPDGFVGGLHAGYLWQSDSLVFGLEGDVEYSDINGSSEVETPAAVPALTLSNIDYDIDWLASLRLRLGFAMDRALIYATGGLAVGGVSLDSNVAPILAAVGVTDADEDDTQWGWTVGGGIDYAIWDDVSIRLEYRYTDLGTTEVANELPAAANLNVFDNEVDNTFHAVRGGISWRFR